MKDFERFKKKALREHGIKSALVGLGTGLLAAALAIVVSFLTNPAIAPWVGSIAGAVSAAAFGYLYWHQKKPTDKQIALMMDKRLGLNERCATMIEYRDKDDALVNRQREDVKERLAEKPTKALKLRLSVWVVPALALSSALFAASMFTPKNANGIEPGVSIVDSSGNVIDSLTSSLGGDAHSNISENSGANSEFKDIVDSIVNDVVNSLTGISDIPMRSSIVNDAKSHVNDAVDSFNSKEEIGKALKTEADQHLKSQGQHLIDGDIQGLRQDFQDMFDDLDQLEGDELRDYAEELADQIDDALAKAKLAGVSEDDSLYQSYKELADWLRNLQDIPHDSTTSSDSAHDAAESAIAKAASNVASNINEQNENEQIASKVKEIMDSMIDPQPKSSTDDSDGDDSNPDNTIINTETSGSDSSASGPHETTTQGPVPSGTIVDTSVPDDDPQPGPGPTPQPGPDDSTGSGPAGPGQPTDDPHTDIIYTGEDTVEYGSVITSYNGGFADDMTSGDADDGDAADEYFNNLFGSGGK